MNISCISTMCKRASNGCVCAEMRDKSGADGDVTALATESATETGAVGATADDIFAPRVGLADAGLADTGLTAAGLADTDKTKGAPPTDIQRQHVSGAGADDCETPSRAQLR